MLKRPPQGIRGKIWREGGRSPSVRYDENFQTVFREMLCEVENGRWSGYNDRPRGIGAYSIGVSYANIRIPHARGEASACC